MPNTIRNEVKRNIRNPLDLDNLRRRYHLYDKDHEIDVRFPSFQITVLDKHFFNLLTRSKTKDFIPRWDKRPDYLSYDEYGTVIYWPIILFVNSIRNIEEFTGLNRVYIPNIEVILEVARDIENISDLEEYQNDPEVNQKAVFYKRYPLDELERERQSSSANLAGTETEAETVVVLRQNTELFTLTATDISNKYIDLEYTPYTESSISLKIDDFITEQIYGYDFVMKTVDGSKIRLSWADADITLSNGMENILEEGSRLTITYTYSVS